MIMGIDVLGGARYPKLVLKHVPAGWALGFFWDTFGPIEKLLHKVAAKRTIPLIGPHKFPLVRVQGIWSDTHTFPVGKSEKAAIEIARRYNKIAAKYPHVTWQYSPWCEHRESKTRMEALFSKLQDIAPHLELVNTPINGGSFADNAINEWHHSNPAPNKGPAQFSYDGLSSFDSDIEKAKQKARGRGAKVFFFWFFQCNLKMNAHDKTPRALRKAVPHKALFKTAEILATPKKVDSLPKTWLFKSVSEQHKAPVPDADDMRPVIIGPQKGEIKIRSGNKTIKFDSPVPDAHNPGDWVYRTREVFACDLKRPIEVIFNNQKLGEIDPCFRSSKRYIEE